MRRVFFLAIVVLLLAAGVVPRPTSAAFNDVQLTADTDLVLTDSGVVLVAASGGIVASLTVNPASIEVGMESGSTITFRSSDRRRLTVSPAIATVSCGSSDSFITLESSTTQTVTLTVTGVCSTASSSSSGGGGGGGGGGGQAYGGGLGAPSGVEVKVNGDAASTASRSVTLTLTASNASQVLVANTQSFSDATSWQSFQPTLPWTLTPGAGSKTVFAKFRSSGGGESSVVSDGIQLLEESPAAVPLPPPPLTPQPSPAAVTPPPTPPPPAAAAVGPPLTGELIKQAGKPAVYLLHAGKLRVFPSAKVFLAHGFQWEQVETVRRLPAVPRGDKVDLPVLNGLLVKATGPNVYLIQDGRRRLITSADVFLGLGYLWSSIRVVTRTTLRSIPEGEAIAQASQHVDGTLVRYAGSPHVYLIEGGRKRLITSADVFRQRGLRWENILIIPDSFTYADGPALNGTPSAAAPAGQVLGVSTETFTRNLRPGDSGDDVLRLQQRLAEGGFFPREVTPNGIFGPTTAASVKRFQRAHGLPVTGTVGPLTRDVLNRLATGN